MLLGAHDLMTGPAEALTSVLDGSMDLEQALPACSHDLLDQQDPERAVAGLIHARKWSELPVWGGVLSPQIDYASALCCRNQFGDDSRVTDTRSRRKRLHRRAAEKAEAGSCLWSW